MARAVTPREYESRSNASTVVYTCRRPRVFGPRFGHHRLARCASGRASSDSLTSARCRVACVSGSHASLRRALLLELRVRHGQRARDHEPRREPAPRTLARRIDGNHGRTRCGNAAIARRRSLAALTARAFAATRKYLAGPDRLVAHGARQAHREAATLGAADRRCGERNRGCDDRLGDFTARAAADEARNQDRKTPHEPSLRRQTWGVDS